jgi:subtilisin family serine protease
MSRKKSPSLASKMLSSAPVIGALVLSLVLAGIDAKGRINNNYFEADLLQNLQSLNAQHGMTMQPILATPDSPELDELFQANVFEMPDDSVNNRGLVVSVESGEDDVVVLFEPVKPLSDLELQTTAQKYMEVIPSLNVEVDQDVELLGQPSYWSLSRESIIELTEEEPDEEAVLRPIHVAVIDSGVDTDHEVFMDYQVTEGWNAVDHDTNPYDDVGHGTHIASIIIGEVPGAVIAPYKIVNADGGRLSNVLEAFNMAIEAEVDVINTSFGLLSESYSLESLVNEAYNKGIIVVSAAGNRASDEGFYPASFANSIAVASVDDEGIKMPKSNYGYWIDVAANGYNIKAALPDDGYGYKSGTSQACAFVSAAVVKVLAEAGVQNELSFEEVLAKLIENGIPIEDGKLAGIPIVE